MKRLFPTLLLPLCLLQACGTSRVVLQRDHVPEATVVGRFTVIMQTNEAEEAEELADTHPVTIMLELAELGITLEQAKKLVAAGFIPPRYRRLVDGLYEVVSHTLEDRLGLRLLPVDYLRGKVPYNAVGYPQGPVERLAASGAYASVLGVWMSVKCSRSSITVLDRTTYKIYPELTLQVELRGRGGRLLWRDKEKTEAYAPHEFEEPFVFEAYLVSETFNNAVRKLAEQTLEKILLRSVR